MASRVQKAYLPVLVLMRYTRTSSEETSNNRHEKFDRVYSFQRSYSWYTILWMHYLANKYNNFDHLKLVHHIRAMYFLVTRKDIPQPPFTCNNLS